jgi:hypothetical protein
MALNPQIHAEHSEGPKFLHRVAEEMRSLADRDPSIALKLWQMAAELESEAKKIPERTASSAAAPPRPFDAVGEPVELLRED